MPRGRHPQLRPCKLVRRERPLDPNRPGAAPLLQQPGLPDRLRNRFTGPLAGCRSHSGAVRTRREEHPAARQPVLVRLGRRSRVCRAVGHVAAPLRRDSGTGRQGADLDRIPYAERCRRHRFPQRHRLLDRGDRSRFASGRNRPGGGSGHQYHPLLPADGPGLRNSRRDEHPLHLARASAPAGAPDRISHRLDRPRLEIGTHRRLSPDSGPAPRAAIRSSCAPRETAIRQPSGVSRCGSGRRGTLPGR